MITASTIRNILGAMNSIDYGDVDSNVLPLNDWHRFSTAPAAVFPRLCDDQQEAIAAVVSRKLAPIQHTSTGSDA